MRLQLSKTLKVDAATSARTPSPSLLALTSSALLLPAYAAADSAPDTITMGLRYSEYQEDDVKAQDSFGGDSERYDIDVSQFRLLAPVGSNWSVAFDVQRETMSGASPWFVGQSFDGGGKVIMSNASISDARTSLSLSTRYYFDRGNIGVTVGNSDEDDYGSNSLGIDATFNSEDQQRTYSVGISASDDEIEPTIGTTPVAVTEADKESHSLFLGMSQIVSRRAIVQFGLSYTELDGYLTDPYKASDNRPGQRRQWVATSQYRHFFVDADAALHADYRYFDDDWGVKSHTINLAWHQNLGNNFTVVPNLRYYTQQEADFYSVIADPGQRYFADDHRLSSFGAWTMGLKLQARLDNWTFSVSGERYRSDLSYGLFDGDEAPTLLAFTRYTIGLDYRFD